MSESLFFLLFSILVIAIMLVDLGIFKKAGAAVTQAQFVVDLPDLGGADALRSDGIDVHALVAFSGH